MVQSQLFFLLVSLLSIATSLKFSRGLATKVRNRVCSRFSRSMVNNPTDANNVVISSSEESISKNFIVNIIEDDIKCERNGGRVVTRFPPEPNGYLHLGHAKSINFNFGVARNFGGLTNMRFDDTNPEKEKMEYVNSILDDVRWLVTDSTKPTSDPWDGLVRHASDYFETLYEAAVFLIRTGLAYVDDLTPEQMREFRGTLIEPGKDSPHRIRSIEENLELFEAMRAGKFPDGHCILRAKIDNTSPNMNMRDPTLYRIKTQSHPITGDKWCIYPMYDYAHAISDALEGITHSICTLEFADHRPLYDWVIDSVLPSGLLPFPGSGWRPTQIEFSRLNLQYTVLSKRKLIQLVTEKHVDGWDDPRMPTISAIRRRGYPAAALRLFCDRVGISKAENNIDMSVLEECVRDVLDVEAPRALAVMAPLKVTITNWPVDSVETFTAENHPKRPELGNREIPFSGSVFIDSEDFFDTGVDGTLVPPKGYKRLLPGGTVRLKYAYVITCDTVVRDPATGQPVELICSYDSRTRSGATPEGAKKAKGIIQWVSEAHAQPAEFVLFDRLFVAPSPGKDHEDGDFLKDINPNSKKVIANALVEPSIGVCVQGASFQFERLGYFCLDAVDNKPPHDRQKTDILRFNRVVTLKDTWQAVLDGRDSLVRGAAGAVTGSGSGQGSTDKKTTSNQAKGQPLDDIQRVDMRVGVVLSAEKHPDADSLLVEKIDCGDATGPRTVVSGLAKFMTPESLVGKKVVVVCNLKPSKMRGIVSEGMVLAASTPVGVEPPAELAVVTSSEGEEGSGSSPSVVASVVNEVVELLEAPAGAVAGDRVSVEGLGEPSPDASLKNRDIWKRVSTELKTDGNREACYGAQKRRLSTSAGPCFTATLSDAAIG